MNARALLLLFDKFQKYLFAIHVRYDGYSYLLLKIIIFCFIIANFVILSLDTFGLNFNIIILLCSVVLGLIFQNVDDYLGKLYFVLSIMLLYIVILFIIFLFKNIFITFLDYRKQSQNMDRDGIQDYAVENYEASDISNTVDEQSDTSKIETSIDKWLQSIRHLIDVYKSDRQVRLNFTKLSRRLENLLERIKNKTISIAKLNEQIKEIVLFQEDLMKNLDAKKTPMQRFILKIRTLSYLSKIAIFLNLLFLFHFIHIR